MPIEHAALITLLLLLLLLLVLFIISNERRHCIYAYYILHCQRQAALPLFTAHTVIAEYAHMLFFTFMLYT